MPRRRSSLKAHRAGKKRHLRNLRVKRQLKNTIKKFQKLVSAKGIEDAKKLITQVYSQLDKAAKKKIIHPKTANRKKSRLALQLAKQAKAA